MPAPLDALKDVFIPKPGESPGLFQASATIITIATIYLYFTGYVYCYFYYFGFFQIPLETLDTSPQFYWIRAFTALDNAMGIALVCLVILVVLGYLHKRVPTWVTILVMVGAFPALFTISRSEAMSDARWKVCRPPNAVRLHFKEPAKESRVPSPGAQAEGTQGRAKPEKAAAAAQAPTKVGAEAESEGLKLKAQLGLAPDVSDPRELSALEDKGELFLLLQTKESLVLVRAPGCDASIPPRMKTAVHIYTVPRADVDLTNLSLQ